MKRQPTHCIVLKTIWILSLLLAIVGLIGFIINMTMVNNNTLGLISYLLVGFCPILAIGLFPSAFEPELESMKMKKELYIQSKTRELQEEYLSTDADIKHRSIKKKARSVKQGLSVENCPKCGDKVDANENFCSKCGSPIYLKCKKCNTINEATDTFCRTCGNKLK